MPSSNPSSLGREISARGLALLLLGAALVLLLGACASTSHRGMQRGVASWYGPQFHGKATASGEIYDMEALTAAHQTLPFDTVVEVRNLDNGRKVRVRINDRGPFVDNRIIDLSKAAAREIEMLGPGTAKVEILLLEPTVLLAESPRYTVQVGAFRDRDNAEDLLRKLENRFDGVQIQSESGLHKVRIGLFARRSAADELVRELASARYSAVVITLPPAS